MPEANIQPSVEQKFYFITGNFRTHLTRRLKEAGIDIVDDNLMCESREDQHEKLNFTLYVAPEYYQRCMEVLAHVPSFALMRAKFDDSSTPEYSIYFSIRGEQFMHTEKTSMGEGCAFAIYTAFMDFLLRRK